MDIMKCILSQQKGLWLQTELPLWIKKKPNIELCQEDHGQQSEGSYYPSLAGGGDVTAGIEL